MCTVECVHPYSYTSRRKTIPCCSTLYAYIMYWRNRSALRGALRSRIDGRPTLCNRIATNPNLDYTIYNNHSVISNISSLIQLLQIIRREKRCKIYCVLCGHSDVSATLDIAKNPCLRHAPKARIQVDGQADIIVAPVDGKMIDIVKLYLQYIIRSELVPNNNSSFALSPTSSVATTSSSHFTYSSFRTFVYFFSSGPAY